MRTMTIVSGILAGLAAMCSAKACPNKFVSWADLACLFAFTSGVAAGYLWK